MNIGIDWSMTAPAVCAYTTPADEVSFWYGHETKFDVGLTGCSSIAVSTSNTVSRRASYHAAQVGAWLGEQFPLATDVWIEDYAFAATGRVFHIGEHTGILKAYLDQMLIDIHPVPPTVIKKFATGKGNADKAAMTAAFLADYPLAQAWIPKLFPRLKTGASVARSPMSDMADAYWLAKYSLTLNPN